MGHEPEPKAATGRRIFEVTANGMGKRLIAKQLNAKGVPTFGGGPLRAIPQTDQVAIPQTDQVRAFIDGLETPNPPPGFRPIGVEQRPR